MLNATFHWCKKHPTTAFFILGFSLLLLILPVLLQWTIGKVLLSQLNQTDVQYVEIDDVDLNPFTGQFSIYDLNLHAHDQTTPVASLSHLKIDIALLPLLQRQLQIETITLDGLSLPVTFQQSTTAKTQTALQQLQLPGLTLPLDKKSVPENEPSAWEWSVQHITVSNVSIALHLHESNQASPIQQNQIEIKQLNLSPEADFHRFIINSQLNQRSIKGNVKWYQFPATRHLSGTLVLNQLKLQSLRPWLALFGTTPPKLSAQLSSDITFHLEQSEAGYHYQQQGELSLQQLKTSSETGLLEGDKIHWQGSIDVIPEKEKSPSIDVDGLLSLDRITAQQEQILFTLNQGQWQGTFNMLHSNPDAITMQAKLVLDALQTNYQLDRKAMPEDKLALSLAKLALPAITIKQNQFALQNLSLEQLEIDSQNAKQHDQSNIAIKRIDLDKLTIALATGEANATNVVSLSNTLLEGGQATLSLNPQGEPAIIYAVTPSQTPETIATPPESPDTEKSPPPTWHFNSASVKLATPLQIKLQPQTAHKNELVRALPLHIAINQFELGSLNSESPLKPTPYQLKLTMDEFSHIHSSGEVTLLSPTEKVQSITTLDHLSLPPFSTLAEQWIGYRISQGQLNARVDLSINQQTLDAKNELKIQQLEMHGQPEPSAENKPKIVLDMPLEAGLALLKDKQNNIQLSLPVSGKLSDLQVSADQVISQALNKAIMKASQSYLLYTLQPFGAIALVTELFESQLNAIQLQPITFTAGESTLTDDMQPYLQKLKQLLSERPKLTLKLCGGTSELDRIVLLSKAQQALLAQTKQATNQKNNANNVTNITIDNATLLTLAQQRQTVIKRQLVALGSNAGQILLCQPSIDSTTETPAVSLGI